MSHNETDIIAKMQVIANKRLHNRKGKLTDGECRSAAIAVLDGTLTMSKATRDPKTAFAGADDQSAAPQANAA